MNHVPLKDTWTSSPLVSVNVTFFGNRVLAGVIKLGSHTVSGWTLNPRTSDLITKERSLEACRGTRTCTCTYTQTHTLTQKTKTAMCRPRKSLG